MHIICVGTCHKSKYLFLGHHKQIKYTQVTQGILYLQTSEGVTRQNEFRSIADLNYNNNAALYSFYITTLGYLLDKGL